MLNSSDLEKFILERTQKIAEARKEINYKQQCLKLEYSPRGADEKENTNFSNQTPFQVLNQKKKEAGRNEKQISTPLQSNRQMPVLPPVDILHESNASSVIETPKIIRRRKPHGEVALVNCRELEKQRLASAMASTTGSAVLGCNPTQKSPQLTQRTRLVESNSMPVVSPRQLEIDRLAKLFSKTSDLSNQSTTHQEYSPRGADEKENTNFSNQTPFQVLSQKKKEAVRNEKQISTSLQSNRQMPVLPPVDILHESNASSVIETPKIIRRRKPHGEVALVNCRELEKQRLASAMASTTGSAVLGCNSTQKSPQITRFVVAKPLLVVSPRQLEIDRLAKLFEYSQESCSRNSRNVVDEYSKTPDQSPTACHTLRPAPTTSFDDDRLSRRENDLAEISVNDADLSNNNDTNERIPSILKTSDHRSNQSTTHQAHLKVRNPRGEPQISYYSHDVVRLKDIATQTDDEPPNPYLLEPDDYRVMGSGLSLPTSPEYSHRSRSPMRSPRGRGNLDLHKSAYCFPGISPSTPVFDKPADGEVGKPTSEMYIRQYQYREELKKQIEERQKLEAERKERERLEEEAIEKRVREQQEKLRRQYEIEEQERLDYIMRRHIQDDVLRQRLADIQLHDTREKPAAAASKEQRMRPVKVTHCSNQEPQPSQEDSNQVPAAEPGDPVSQLIESAEDMLKAPLLADNDARVAVNAARVGDNNARVADNNSRVAVNAARVANNDARVAVNNARVADNNARVANNDARVANNDARVANNDARVAVNNARVADNNARVANNDARVANNDARVAHTACSAPLPPPLPPSPRLETHSVASRRQADEMLGEPVLSPGDASPCRRQPVLKAVSPCVSVKPRSNNAQILDNKWQVPAVEESYIQPRAALGGNYADQLHSSPDNVLTQLSSFRRQLQMEHFRLIERMQQQSKRRSP